MAQSNKFSLYNAGLQDKMFAVNDEYPSPQSQQRPTSARSRMSSKSAAGKQHRPGSATPHPSSHRSKGSSLKPQSGDHHRASSAQQQHPLQPVPPGQSRGGKRGGHQLNGHREKEAAGPDMRPFLVLGREELLGQLTNSKKKQAQSEAIINQLKAENQRCLPTLACIPIPMTICCTLVHTALNV